MAAPAFRFRAQAALDLRRREEQQAQRDLARAEGDRDVARTQHAAAVDAAAGARAMAADAAKTARSTTELQWYRFWIVRLDHERHGQAAVLADREAAVTAAADVLASARRRRESLDKFRTKAREAFDAIEAAADRKLIDELATRRFAAAGRERNQGATS